MREGGEGAAAPSRHALEAAAMFGLVVGEKERGEYEEATEHAARTAARVQARLWGTEISRGLVALITGPSGGGKSLVMAKLAELLGPGAVVAREVRADEDRAVVDLFERPLGAALRTLARAGLAEARLFARSVKVLSEGERFRLRLALAMERAEVMREAEPGRAVTILVDEFCTALDRVTAAGVCAMVGRWVRETVGVGVVAASSHGDVEEWLRPDVVVRQEVGREAGIEERRKWTGDSEEWAFERGIRIREGTRREYGELSRFHYRGGGPATWARVLVAEERGESGKSAKRQSGKWGFAERGVRAEMGVVGVLVVSMPALNGAWRGVAWAGRYASGDKRVDARRLNEEVRTISRVVVEPRRRGMGVATRLVRAYLDDPLTERTEAIAAMGACCPVFAAAGMREVSVALSKRDERLRRAMARECVEAWELADAARLRGLEGSRELERALRIWADGSRGTRRLKGARMRELLRAAARGMGERRVYVAG